MKRQVPAIPITCYDANLVLCGYTLTANPSLAALDDHLSIIRMNKVREKPGLQKLVPRVAGNLFEGTIYIEDFVAVVDPNSAAESVEQFGMCGDF